MSLQERLLIIKHCRENFHHTGTVTPSSRFLARAMTAPLASVNGDPAPVNVLEVGIGTGTLTRAIAIRLRPQDRLVAYEINDEFVAWIREQMSIDPALIAARDRIEIVHAPIQNIARVPAFDFIISSLPFSNFPPELVRDILDVFRAIVKPGGTVSLYEYVGSHTVRLWFAKADERRRLRGVIDVIREFRGKHIVTTDFVLFNVPPAYARHLRFE